MRLDTNYSLPYPVTFNCWKHHAGFIKDRLLVYNKNDIPDTDLKKLLLVIGNSQMDIYLGKLSPATIANEIINKLSSSGCYSATEYYTWISGTDKGFKLITISDLSFWTLRIGNLSNRYIHIHPGRQSPFTVRVKALTLKTTIAVIIRSKANVKRRYDIAFVNNIRKNLLDVSPLKSLQYSSGLGKLINLFDDNIG
jgi:hypothetical protein